MNDTEDSPPPNADTRAYKVKSPGSGVYQVRLVGEDAANSANLSFTGTGTVRTVNLRPGSYTAWIEPLGGGAIRQDVTLDAAGIVQLKDDVSWGLDTSLREGPARPSWSGSSQAKATARDTPQSDHPFVIGLSVDSTPGQFGGWKGATPRMVQNDADGAGLVFQFKRPTDWRTRYRWRMTISIGGRGPWRVPLPMFRGGLQVTLAPTMTPTGPDVALTLAPMDPAKAALVASLHQIYAGTAADVVRAAASAGIPGTAPLASAVDILSDRLDDPWAAAAAALLMARSGEIDKVEDSARRLHDRFPWLPDAMVAVAWADAGTKGPPAEVEAKCFEGIQKARKAGATYFTAADSLVVDMLTALSMSASDKTLQKQARRELGVWTRRSRRRMPSGPFLSWEDPLTAKGEPRLIGADYRILAKGCLTGDKVVVERKAPPAPATKRLSAPALSRPIKYRDDLNKGRFGGKSRVEGYSLEATFGRGASSWVRVNLLVRAAEGSSATEVEFFLHDSFDPDRLKIPFKEGEATFSTLAYGGFTVGAWIAQVEVELELDLTRVRGAPRTIVEN